MEIYLQELLSTDLVSPEAQDANRTNYTLLVSRANVAEFRKVYKAAQNVTARGQLRSVQSSRG